MAVVKEQDPEEQGDAGERKLREDGRGEPDVLAAEAESRLDALLPGVDVFLEFAGEELAHFGIETVHVGGQGEDGQQERNDYTASDGHGFRLPFLFAEGAFLFTAGAVWLRGRPFVLCASERAIRPVPRPNLRRRVSSFRAIS